jgi:hypothetical protein
MAVLAELAVTYPTDYRDTRRPVSRLKKNTAMGPAGPESMYDCAGEDQQLFNRPTD